MTNDEEIKTNIETLMSRVKAAAGRSGRKTEDITLVAVTKTVPPEKIMHAVDAGLSILGENRVQELTEKYDIIDRKVSWHLIGHLQTNKVKYIVGKVGLVHSLDSFVLAAEMQKRAEKLNTVMNVLVQVNIAEEESKYGLSLKEADPFIRSISSLPNIRVRGLMTIAPYAENPEEIRYVFRKLAKLRIDISRENIDNINMDYLSMGMSNDFEIAIEEGSNMIRIGTAVFGHR